MNRRAKIVCTLGPATSSYERLHELIAAGMDVARFNLSHGSHELHKEVYDRVRAAATEQGRAVGLLADLQGPKIRVGRFAEGPVRLGFGDTLDIAATFSPSPPKKFPETASRSPPPTPVCPATSRLATRSWSTMAVSSSKPSPSKVPG